MSSPFCLTGILLIAFLAVTHTSSYYSVRTEGVLFSVGSYVCVFVGYLTIYLKNYWMDLHQIWWGDWTDVYRTCSLILNS